METKKRDKTVFPASAGGGEIILYQPDDYIKLNVWVDSDTVWLNRLQMAQLFDRDIKTIGKHIHNALKEELQNFQVVANFATTAADGKNYQMEYYNLDMILSIGYRVKSQRGVQFRRWATSILRNYLLTGYAVHERFKRIEGRLSETEKKVDFLVKTEHKPKEGIFYDGQIFDAYVFVSDLIKSAEKSVVLLDNYVDESTLLLLSKRAKSVSATIYTSKISPQFQLDLQKHNAQYPPVLIVGFTRAHDRFLLVDEVVYHIGASLKDLGKKLFAFSKMETTRTDFLKGVLSIFL